MEALAYKNYRELVNAHCQDCERRNQHGCRDVDPLDCMRVNDALKKKQEDGYMIFVGHFEIKPL